MAQRVWRLAAAATALGIAAAAAALAQPAAFSAAGGDYSGAYTCSQGLTGMTMSLRPGAGGTVDATVVFYAHPDNPGVESGCYAARGRLDANGHLLLVPGAWIYRPGPGWTTTQFDGRLDAAHGTFTGRVIAPRNPSACTTFALRRGAVPFKAAPAQCAKPALVG